MKSTNSLKTSHLTEQPTTFSKDTLSSIGDASNSLLYSLNYLQCVPYSNVSFKILVNLSFNLVYTLPTKVLGHWHTTWICFLKVLVFNSPSLIYLSNVHVGHVCALLYQSCRVNTMEIYGHQKGEKIIYTFSQGKKKHSPWTLLELPIKNCKLMLWIVKQLLPTILPSLSWLLPAGYIFWLSSWTCFHFISYTLGRRKDS